MKWISLFLAISFTLIGKASPSGPRNAALKRTLLPFAASSERSSLASSFVTATTRLRGGDGRGAAGEGGKEAGEGQGRGDDSGGEEGKGEEREQGEEGWSDEEESSFSESEFQDAERGDEEMLMTGHTSWILGLVHGKGRVWSGSANGKVLAWDCATGECMAEMETLESQNTDLSAGGVNCLALIDDALWAGTTSGVIHAWDTGSCKLLRQFGYQDPMFPPEHPPHQHVGSIDVMIAGNKIVLTGCADGRIRVWRSGMQFERALEGHSDTIFALSFSGESKLLSGSRDQHIRIWDLKTWKCEHVIDTLSRVYALAFFEKRIFSAPADGSIQVWRTDTWESECVLEGHGRKEEDKDFAAHHETPVFTLSVDKARKRLISGSSDGTVRIWSLSSLKCTSVLQGHKEPVWATTLDLKSGEMWSGGSDCAVRKWNVK